MLISTTNEAVANQFRKENQNGKDYLVVPGVILQNQVMNDHYAPVEEMQNSVVGWNGRAVVIRHPVKNDGSVNVPEPDVPVIGRFYKAQWDEAKQRVTGEYWIDPELANMTPDGVRVLNDIYANRPLETSTGYFANNDPTPGEVNGKAYNFIHRDLQPDHIAILPNAEGACSLKDGCGFNVNCANCPGHSEANVLSKAHSPSYSGTETTSWESVSKTLSAFAMGCEKHKGMKDIPANVKDMPAEVKSWIASKTLLGDPKADNEHDLMMFPVVNPSTNKLNAGALRAVMSGRGSAANIPAEALDSARNIARGLLEKEFKLKGAKNMKLAEFIESLKSKGIKATLNEDNEVQVEEAQPVTAPEPKPLFSEEELKALHDLASAAPAIQNALTELPAAVQMAHNAATQAEAHKNELVAQIVANQSNQFTEAMLKGMAVDSLEQYNASLNTSFVGAGGGRITIVNEDEGLQVRPVLLAKKEA